MVIKTWTSSENNIIKKLLNQNKMVVIKMVVGIITSLVILSLFYGIGLVTIKMVFKEDPYKHELHMRVIASLIGVTILAGVFCFCALGYELGNFIMDYLYQ